MRSAYNLVSKDVAQSRQAFSPTEPLDAVWLVNTRCKRKPKVSLFMYRCRTNAVLWATRLFPYESGFAVCGNPKCPYARANCVIALAWLLFLQRCVVVVIIIAIIVIWRHSFIFITMCVYRVILDRHSSIPGLWIEQKRKTKAMCVGYEVQTFTSSLKVARVPLPHTTLLWFVRPY